MSNEPRPAGGVTADDGLRSYLGRVVMILDVPQGYTLTIGATFALTAHRYGSPFFVEAWGFVVGAVLAFVGVALLASEPPGLPPLPSTRRVLFNLTPLATVGLTWLVVGAIPWRFLGFAAGGFVAAASYALLLAVFVRFAAT